MRFFVLSLLACGTLAVGMPWYATHASSPKFELRYDQSLDVTVSPHAPINVPINANANAPRRTSRASSSVS